MSYFVTGATGFIGRHLVERLLEREGDIHVLVREESQEKLDALRERWGGGDRSSPSSATSCEPLLGVSEEDREALEGVDHFFHLAAIYDMTADEERNRRAQRQRHPATPSTSPTTRRGPLPPRLLDRGRRRLRAATSPRTPSTRARAPHPYHRTKYEAEKLVRERIEGAWRVYRPSVVVGNSRPARWTRSTGRTTSSRRSRRRATRCRSGSRSSASRSAGRTSSPSTTSRRRWTTSRTCPASTARPSTSSTRRCSARATSSTSSPRPATRRRWSCASTSR